MGAQRNLNIATTYIAPPISSETLQLWLEWAGGKLLALPASKTKPQKLHGFWPAEYQQNPYEILDFRPKESLSIRGASPTAEEIPYMDRILTLVNLCGDMRFRRVMHARSLVFPFNGRYLYPWTRLAEVLNVSRNTVKTWHHHGLLEVCKQIPFTEYDQINAFFYK